MSEVDKLISKFDPKRKKLVEVLQKIVKKAIPQASEVVKWGKPTYVIGKKNIAWILPYKNHVDLGFFQGARLKSPLLEGTGKGLRHIKIRTVEDIKETEFAKLLKVTSKIP